jgi:hypothetical protein
LVIAQAWEKIAESAVIHAADFHVLVALFLVDFLKGKLGR